MCIRDSPSAESHFRKACELKPEDASLRGNLGKSLLDQGKLADASGELEIAVNNAKDGKPSLAAMLNLAWIRAVASDADLRDGEQALRLATTCAEMTRFGDPLVLDRLAAAYAELGKFAMATTYQQQAIKLAKSKRRSSSYVTELENRQQAYKNKQPVRMDPKSGP